MSYKTQSQIKLLEMTAVYRATKLADSSVMSISDRLIETRNLAITVDNLLTLVEQEYASTLENDLKGNSTSGDPIVAKTVERLYNRGLYGRQKG